MIDPLYLLPYNSDESLSISNDEFFFSYNRTRDIIMLYDDGHFRCLLALEIQSSNHYFMPARVNNYDDLTMMGQIYHYDKHHERFQSFDAIPIITLVLYLGEDSWNAPTSLLDMCKSYIPETIKTYCTNHVIHMIETRDLIYDEKFSIDKENQTCLWLIKTFFNSHKPLEEILDCVDIPALTRIGALFVASTIKDEQLLELINTSKGDMINMCKNLEREKEEIRNEGKLIGIEEGKVIGLEEGKVIGLEEGKISLLSLLLESRFGESSQQINSLLKKSSSEKLLLLAKNIFHLQSIEDVYTLLS